MKSAGLFTTFTLFLFIQISKEQQNGLLNNNQNIETNNLVSQQQPSLTMANILQTYLNQNIKPGALPNNVNQRQGQAEFNLPPPLPNIQELQQPPDLNQIPQLQSLLQEQQPLQVQQFLQLKQPLQFQQPSQAQQLQTQQPISLQQKYLQQTPSLQETIDLVPTPVIQQQNNYQQSTNPRIHLKLQPTNGPQPVNIGQPFNTQNIIQTQQNPTVRSAEVNIAQPKSFNKNQDISAVRYHISSQQPSSVISSNPPTVSNPSIALIPSYNIKPVDQTYKPPYDYVKPIPEIQPAVVERTTSINPVQVLPSILTLPSPTLQNTNTQTYYYNQASDARQNVYVNQNPGFLYPHQSQTSVTSVQSQPTALIQSQPTILSPVPVSIVQTSQVPSQYAISSAYPINTIVSPTYTSQKSKPLNLKSLLPLILNLLKEKIATYDSQNGCACQCKNKNGNNYPEVSSGYSSHKRYGVLKEDNPSDFNNVSEEFEGSECLRKRKNCKKNEKVVEVNDVSAESEDDEDSDEEDNSDDEED